MRHRGGLLLVVVSAIYAQQAPVGQRAWGAVSGPWQLSILADKAQYRVGEPVTVDAMLKNVSSEPAVFVYSDPWPYQIDVYVPFPSWIPIKPQASRLPAATVHAGDMGSDISIQKPAGWQFNWTYDLTKMFDLSAPGEYRIVFSTTQPPNAATPGRQRFAVKSNEIVVRVSAKEK